MIREYYTTGQIARLMNVSLTTVLRWTSSGELGCTRMPGRGDRRVKHSDLAKFLRSHGYWRELRIIGGTGCLVICLGLERAFFDDLCQRLPALDMRHCENLMELGEAVGLSPHIVLIDIKGIGFAEGHAAAQWINQKLRLVPVIAIEPEDRDVSPSLAWCFSAKAKHPIIPDILVQKIEDYIPEELASGDESHAV